uniref:RING-type domain-containing protein n=1 Tax=Ananas comosus var. bracteatus TaxID=296719 RepID=A0A6V7PJX1_ANACO|nr:unnamed protein product [Ananas comosus var. bracteatus]
MGFPSVCYCVILPKPLTLTIQLLDYIRLSILLSLSYLGLAAAPFEEHTHPTVLGDLELEHEVRELGNCSHAFHKGCIDKWVEIGHATCPLCRALLWPIEWGRINFILLKEVNI